MLNKKSFSAKVEETIKICNFYILKFFDDPISFMKAVRILYKQHPVFQGILQFPYLNKIIKNFFD